MIDSKSLEMLPGMTVHGPDDSKVGKIVDVYESTDGSGPSFATVKTGILGGDASFIPLHEATMTDDKVVIPYDKDIVKDAPRVKDDAELTAPEEEELYTYYSGVGSAPLPTGGSGHDTSGPDTDDAMTRSEEQLHVGTETREAGRARLRKYVVTENVQTTVPVSREELRIEREPITDDNRGKAMDGPGISEEEHEIVLTEERPVISKETVPVERVRVGKETVTEQREVNESVRKEQIEFDEQDSSSRG